MKQRKTRIEKMDRENNRSRYANAAFASTLYETERFAEPNVLPFLRSFFDAASDRFASSDGVYFPSESFSWDVCGAVTIL